MKRLILVATVIGLVSACGTTTPVAVVSANPQASTTPSATVSPNVLTGFALSDFSGGSVAVSSVSSVRIGRHDGYDRFVIEFSGGVPTYTVTRQSSATFTRSPKGDQVALDGSAGVVIVVHSISNWSTYTDPTAFKPGFACIREAQLTENFEGYQSWALGINGTPALRVFTLTAPNRLVVDVAVA
jgi:hypothetical protein